MRFIHTKETERGRQLQRILQLIVMLSRRGYTTHEIAGRFKTSKKTTQRDLRLIENAGLPLYTEPGNELLRDTHQGGGSIAALYRLDPHWMQRFL